MLHSQHHKSARTPASAYQKSHCCLPGVVLLPLLPSGSAVFQRLSKHFDVVIVDEAAQAVEPSVMVPLVMGCKQVRTTTAQLTVSKSPSPALAGGAAQCMSFHELN
jgi:hypothetical protein